jgi:outer membrane lipopolysaccharide assembly protein LptE/RlpB
MKRSLKHLLLCASIALLAACGSQESANIDRWVQV